jgi:hypothetical protein
MLDSPEMVFNRSGLHGSLALVFGLIVLAASALWSDDRPHPSLVDPTITKCTVCHNTIGAVHFGRAAGQDCLSCHTLEQRAGKTVLIVDDGRQSTGTEKGQAAVGTGDEVFDRAATDTSVGQNTSAAQPDPPEMETVAEAAPALPALSATPPQVTDRPAGQQPEFVVGTAEVRDDLYADGLAAFNRADFDRAFSAWRLMLTEKPDHFVVQIEVDTYLESAQSTVARYRDNELFVVKKDDLYWVFSGLFATRAQAAEALRRLPEALRRGGAFTIAVRQIIPLQ